MRWGAVMVLLAGALAASCGPEKPPPVVGQDDVTAAHLRSLDEGHSTLRYLEPTEEEARALAEEERAETAQKPGDEGWIEDHELEEEPTTQKKWEQTSIAVLKVAVTVGAMVAPYFLF
jgi:hypothetical protein